MLVACGEPKLQSLDLPEDIDAVTQGFVSALDRGDTAAARRYIAPSSRQYFDTDFTGDSAFKISKGLQPVLHLPKDRIFEGGSTNNVAVVYAKKKDEKWQTLELQLFWLDGEKVEIDDWNFIESGPPPPQIAAEQAMMRSLPWFLAVLAFLSVFVLAFIVWLAKRKPQVIAPESVRSRENSATTRSSDGKAG